MSEAGKTDVAMAEVTVTAVSSGKVTGMTPKDFVSYLKANGFKGNVSTNETTDKAWIGFWNNKE